MRFTSLILAGVFALVASAASDSTSTTATATASSAASATTTDAAQASMINCINHCDASDTKCRANCITVPAPSNQQANDTITCVDNCPKGSGSAADNTAYGNCVNKCIGQYFYTSTGAPPGASATGTATGSGSGSGSSSGSGSGSSGSGSSASGSSGSSGTSTASSSSSSSTSKSNAAALQMGASAVGLVGFLAAFLAL